MPACAASPVRRANTGWTQAAHTHRTPTHLALRAPPASIRPQPAVARADRARAGSRHRQAPTLRPTASITRARWTSTCQVQHASTVQPASTRQQRFTRTPHASCVSLVDISPCVQRISRHPRGTAQAYLLRNQPHNGPGLVAREPLHQAPQVPMLHTMDHTICSQRPRAISIWSTLRWSPRLSARMYRSA